MAATGLASRDLNDKAATPAAINDCPSCLPKSATIIKILLKNPLAPASPVKALPKVSANDVTEEDTVDWSASPIDTAASSICSSLSAVNSLTVCIRPP